MPHQTYLCPHCQRVTISEAHAGRCPDNPAVHAKIAAAMSDPANPGHAISSMRYARQAKAAGVPSEGTINQHYGSWADAVTAFGLRLAIVKPKRARNTSGYRDIPRDTAPCPHCGKSFLDGVFVAKHVIHCPQRPGIMEQVKQLAEDAAHPGVGVDSGEYLRRLAAHRTQDGAPVLPALSTLERHFGGWGGTLHHLGLITRDEAMEARARVDNERYRSEWRATHAAELESWGLPVASVQKPVPVVRRLPSGGTAMMIR